MAKEALTVEETAGLLRARDPSLVEEMFDAARRLKRDVCGNRIVLFASLYISKECVNGCGYCVFNRSNRWAVRRTLDPGEVPRQVEAMERRGRKPVNFGCGEHTRYSPGFIAECVRTVYAVKVDHGGIRRVDVNAVPMDHEGFRIIRGAGIGTYQSSWETYHHETYARYHPADTRKGDYLWRLDALSRAQEAGIDDVGALGQLRVERTRRILDRTDLALLVAEAGFSGPFEDRMLDGLRARGAPVIVVFNKMDLADPQRPRGTA